MIRDYTQAINTAFSGWKNKPLNAITEAKVLKRHKECSKEAPTRATNEGRSLFIENPVCILSHLRVLKPARRKQTIIKNTS